MEVMIANALDTPVHVAVVRHSRLAIEFVISPERVPVPTGRIMRRDDVGPDLALLMNGFDDETCFSASFEGFIGTLRATLIEGANKEGPFVRLTLLGIKQQE